MTFTDAHPIHKYSSIVRFPGFSLITYLLLAHSVALAEDPTADELFEGELREMCQQVLKDISRSLSGTERRVVDSIEFVYTPSSNTMESPRAYSKNGKRFVAFGIEFYRALGMGIGDTTVIQVAKKQSNATTKYMKYAIPLLMNNSRKAVSERVFIKDPYSYFNISIEDAIALRQNTDYGLSYTGAVLGSTAFVIAHELAHHVLGHSDTPPKSLQESREREEAADLWACKTLLRSGYMPIAGVLSLTMFYFMDQDAIKHERQRTHPAEIRRIEAMIDATLGNLSLFKERLNSLDIPLETIKQQLLFSKQKIKEELGRQQ